MAIYHLSVKTISRSAGRSATAAAAYRSASVIHDDRTGITHDYSKKKGVISASIITPDGAPDWARNRAELWNAAEAAENRKNSVTAREFEVSLPSELGAIARSDLAHQFAAELSERHQVAVDIALHAPGKEGDDRNHHAHLLLTTRTLGADGFGKKTRELDARKSGEVARWRERWADLVNGKLEQAGLSIRVDHRSHKDRGIEDEPTIHVGPTATTMERQGEQTNRGDINRSIQERNQRRRSAARELAEAEAEYKTAQRRSQQAREQAKRQQAPGPAPTHGSAALDQDAHPVVPAHLAAIADSLAAPSPSPMPTHELADIFTEEKAVLVNEIMADAKRKAQEQMRQEKKVDIALSEEHRQREEQAERDWALSGLAKFRHIVGERASKITTQAAERAEQLQAEQRRVWQQQRELAEERPRPPGALARMFGAGPRYEHERETWQVRVDRLREIDQQLRADIEAERRRHSEAADEVARELGQHNPALVQLAERGFAIEERERKEREADRQREAEQRERERAKARRRERKEAKRKQAEYEAQWAERAVARLLTHVDDPRSQLRILEDNRRLWTQREPSSDGVSRDEWKQHGAVLDARIKSLRGDQEHQVDKQKHDQAPRRRPRGPG